MSKKKKEKRLLYFKLVYAPQDEHLSMVNDGNIIIKSGRLIYEFTETDGKAGSPTSYSLSTTLERKIQLEKHHALQAIQKGDYKYISTSNTTDGDKAQSLCKTLDNQEESFPLDDDYVSYFQALLTEMISASIRVIELAKWRTGSSLDLGNLPDISKLFWSEDKKDWNKLFISRNSGFIKIGGPLESSQEIEKDLSAFVANQVEVPVYRKFIDQALQDFKPDSAIVMAVAALEIAVKQTVQKIHPETDWLLKEMPSPPVMKILKDYFPQLTSPFIEENEGFYLSTELLEQIENAVSARNNIVHKGGIKWDELKRYDIIVTLEFVIRWLEYFQGHIWSPEKVPRRPNQGIVVKNKFEIPDNVNPFDTPTKLWALQQCLLDQAELKIGRRLQEKKIYQPVWDAEGPHLRNTSSNDGAYAELGSNAKADWGTRDFPS